MRQVVMAILFVLPIVIAPAVAAQKSTPTTRLPQGCDAVSLWLDESWKRVAEFEPLVEPLMTSGLSIDALTRLSDESQRLIEDQQDSGGPAVADDAQGAVISWMKLNEQLADAALSGDQLTYDRLNSEWIASYAKIFTEVRSLKLECDLLNVLAFVDLSCHGQDFLAWVGRTGSRTSELGAILSEAGRKWMAFAYAKSELTKQEVDQLIADLVPMSKRADEIVAELESDPALPVAEKLKQIFLQMSLKESGILQESVEVVSALPDSSLGALRLEKFLSESVENETYLAEVQIDIANEIGRLDLMCE